MKVALHRIASNIFINDIVYGSLSVILSVITPAIFFVSKNYSTYSRSSILLMLAILVIGGIVVAVVCLASSRLFEAVFRLVLMSHNPLSRSFALVSAISSPLAIYAISMNFSFDVELGLARIIASSLLAGLLLATSMLLALLVLNRIIGGSRAVFELPGTFGRRSIVALLVLCCLLSSGAYIKSRFIGTNLLQDAEGRNHDDSAWQLQIYQPGGESASGIILRAEDGALRARYEGRNKAKIIGLKQSLNNFEKYAGKTLTLSGRIRGPAGHWVQVFITDGTGTEQGYAYNGGISSGEFFGAEGEYLVTEAAFTVSPSPKELSVTVQAHDAEWAGFDWVKLEEGDRATPFIPLNSPLSLDSWMLLAIGLLIVLFMPLMRSAAALPVRPAVLSGMAAACLSFPLIIAFAKAAFGSGMSFSLSLGPVFVLGIVVACAMLTAWRMAESVSSATGTPGITLGKTEAERMRRISYALAVSIAAPFAVALMSEFAWRDSISLSAACIFPLIAAFIIFFIIRKYGYKPLCVFMLASMLVSAFNIASAESRDMGTASILPAPAALPNSYELREKPNIYFIHAESTHSRKGLLDVYDWDYPSFNNDLVEHSFIIHEENVAGNYWTTFNSLLATLSMRHHYYRYEFGNLDLTRSAKNELANNSVFRILKNNGYAINYFSSSVNIFRDYSRYFDYENISIESSSLREIKRIFSDMTSLLSQSQRELFKCIGIWESLKEVTWRPMLTDFKRDYPQRFNLAKPNFMFIVCGEAAHATIPVSDSPPGLSPPNNLEPYKKGYVTTQNEILAVIGDIIAVDPDGLIVVMGDHGAGLFRGAEVFFGKSAKECNEILMDNGIKTEDMAKSALDIMLAIRWPRRMTVPEIPENGLGQVNLFPYIFFALNGEKYPTELFEDNLALLQDAKHLKVTARNGKWLEKWEDMGEPRQIPLAEQ